jgi:hypothetical protein
LPSLEPLEERALLNAVAIGELPGSYLPPKVDLFQPGGYLTGPASGAPRDVAMAYLTSHAGEFGLSASDILHSVVTDQYSDTDSGMTHIYLCQQLNGIPVVNANMNVNVAADGRILSVGGGFVPGLSLLENSTAVASQPVLSAAEAFGRSVGALGLMASSASVKVTATSGDLLQSTTLSSSALSLDPIPAKLQYVATASGIDLTWDYVLRTPDGEHWYELNADSSTGAALLCSDWVDHASYTVFARPTENPDDGPRASVTNPNIPAASPYGWHDTNGASGAEYTDTRGNNVFAQEDWNGDLSGGTRPDGGAALNFDFPLNLSQDPKNYVDASVTNLFYWANLCHDIHYVYGFNEVAGNFQQTNYTGLGVGGDPVQAYAQDGMGMDNAFMATPPDGQSPWLVMFNWDLTSPNRDGDLESVIMTHEFGHGVSNRVVGGPSNANALDALQSAGMGEGWSDWWGLMFTQKASDTKMGSYPVGNYVLGWPPNGPGIRTYPYSFDMTVDPHTYNDYNGGWPNYESHNAGEIWCTALWDLNWLLIDKYGFNANLAAGYTGPGSAGNILALKLVMDSLKLLPANPTFLDGRDAVLQADVALTGGANQWEIWTAFARRGMGLSAYDGGNANATTVVAAYDVPNAAPVLTAPPTSMTLRPVRQGDPNNFGTRVAAILASAGTDPITDQDPHAVEGIAVIAAKTTSGSWQYSTDNGAHWLALGTPSSTAARLLAADAGTRIRFLPNPGFQGTVASGITFRAWDQTSGQNGGTANITSTGGITAFSVATATASVTVTQANHAPVLDTNVPLWLTPMDELDPGVPSNNETLIGDMLSPTGQCVITDADGDQPGIALVGVDKTNGSWEYKLGGTTDWRPVGTPSLSRALLLTAADSIRFCPKEYFDGTVNPAISFRAWDQTSGETGYTTNASAAGGTSAFSTEIGSASITVNLVNHAPVLDDPHDLSLNAIDEGNDTNVGTLISSILASSQHGDPITDADYGAVEGIALFSVDEDDGSWQYSTDNGSNWNDIDLPDPSASQALLLAADASTRLRFVPNPSFHETVTNGITFYAWDRTTGSNGDTADVADRGGATAFSTDSASASITVWPRNDPPVADDQDVIADEHQSVTIVLTGNDAETPTGQLTFAIATPPHHGTLGPIQGNQVVYTPLGHYHGPDSFQFTVTDNGRPAGSHLHPGDLTSARATVTITVNPVNDKPAANAQSLATDEHQSVTITLTGSDVETAAGQLVFAIAGGGGPYHGTLGPIQGNQVVYTPAGHYNGPDSFQFTVTDTGDPPGTSGNVQTSDPATVSITVNAVNGKPLVLSQQVGLDQNQPLPLASICDDGDPEVEQALTFNIVGVPSHGTITTDPHTHVTAYQPTLGYWGPDSFVFMVRDDGTGGKGGPKSSDLATVHLLVNPVVDVPANSNLVLRKSGSYLQLQTLAGGRVTGTPFSALLSAVPKLTIQAAATPVTLSVDFSKGGNFTLPGGVHFAAGSTAGEDVLSVIATAKADTLLVQGGRVDANGLSIAFDKVERLKLDGQAGDDTYRIGALEVPLSISDSSGKDTVDFSPYSGAAGIYVNLSLSKGETQPDTSGKGTLRSLTGIVENVIGSAYADWIMGNSAANIIRGGDGDDTIHGGGGNDILLGENGKDTLTAGTGKSILIGGAGMDTLDGSLGANILIGGTTAYDNNNAANNAALMAILREWTSSHKDRVARIQAGVGTNHAIKLAVPDTVFDDDASDTFQGGQAKNWFLDSERD